MKKTILFITLFIMLSAAACQSQPAGSSVKKVESTEQSPDSQESVSADIEACIRKKVATFEEDCKLASLWYDKEKSESIIDHYMEQGHGSQTGVDRENVIVILSNLETGENTWSFEPNTTYTDWIWILAREDKDSEWAVVDYGNE